MTQRTFFDGPAARALAQTAPYMPGSETSQRAAGAIAPQTGQLRAFVYRFFVRRGEVGATDHEVAGCLGMLLDTARARRVELRDSGHVTDSGKRRSTASGRQATVWTATGKPCPKEVDQADHSRATKGCAG